MELITPRRRTRAVRVGEAIIGGDAPVLVQSMITEETKHVDACVAQIIAMYEAGCELVRVTTPTLADAHCLGEIRARLDARGYRVPLVADVHHQGTEIAVAVAQFVDKVRINPGLFVFRRPRGRSEEYSEAEHRAELEAIEESLLPVIEACQARDIAMRIGVNHGSLAERMLVTYGDTPRGMVESAMEYLREQMPAWRARHPGVETMQVAVMGCVVNGPGESKHANIGISLPGSGESPAAPVFVDGVKVKTLRGERIAEEFQAIVDEYVRTHYGPGAARTEKEVAA
jgi:4-hydroxy-3-methylbut-2-en-1-yl diphosphate synthase IspG/GcpE